MRPTGLSRITSKWETIDAADLCPACGVTPHSIIMIIIDTVFVTEKGIHWQWLLWIGAMVCFIVLLLVGKKK